MSYKPRPIAEINAARRAAILAGAKSNIPKGYCHFCDWRLFGKRDLWCCTEHSELYEAEKKELLGPDA